MIAIINSGGANLNSIIFALQRLGFTARLTLDREEIKNASHVILPGVGTAHNVISNLQKLDLCQTICSLKQPVLGICLGMQIFYEYSCEGDVECLGIMPGKITNIIPQPNLTIPHMGWNRIKAAQQSPLMQGIEDGSFVYFVHSFIASVSATTTATCFYGKSFTAICQKQNFYGVQFHPERSGTIGAKILNNFVRNTAPIG